MDIDNILIYIYYEDIASFLKQMLQFLDGWTDGWCMMYTTVMFLMIGFISELGFPQTPCRFPAQRWLTLLPAPCLKSAAHGSDILRWYRSGGMATPMSLPRGKRNDQPQKQQWFQDVSGVPYFRVDSREIHPMLVCFRIPSTT